MKSTLKSSAESIADEWASGIGATTSNVKLVGEKETITETVDTIKTIKTKTNSTSYIDKPEEIEETTPGRERFVDIFNKHYKARSNILSVKSWLFEILESNADTVNMVDLTKYLMYKATGTSYGVTYFDIAFNKLKQNYTDVSQISQTGGTSNIDGNAGKVYDYLLSKGVPAVGAAAIMGSIENESNFSPTAVNPYSGASGLCQWYQGRFDGLKAFATSKGKEWTDIYIQLDYLWKELNNNYTKVKDTIMSATAEKDLEYATWYWGSWYEVYDDAHQVGYEISRHREEEKERYASAQKWYGQWKQKHTSGNNSTINIGSDKTTAISQAILNKANKNSTPSPGAGWCLAWVDNVYQNAGIEPDRKDTAFQAWEAHGISTNMDNIPIGAAVYGTGHNSDEAGHVGIYIGNGKVVDNVGDINTSTLEEWISWQTDTIKGHKGWLGWGWEDGNKTRGLSE